MSFTIKGRDPRKGTLWEISLEKLATGDLRGETKFRGRPALLKRLMPGIEVHVREGAQSSAEREKYQIYYFWRFLDYLEEVSRSMPGLSPVVIHDLDWNGVETVWRQFIDWLRSQPADKLSNRMRYYLNNSICSIWKNAFQAAVSAGETDKQALDIYVYFKNDKRTSYGGDPLDFDEAKAAFRVLADAWRSILKRIERGQALAASGENPMVGSGGKNRWGGGPWQSFANRLWAVHTFVLTGTAATDEVSKKLRYGTSEYPVPEGWGIQGINPSRTGGINAHLACLCLTRAEMAIAFAMVSMKTGLNPDAIARMRVDGWYRPDLMQPEKRVIVYGPKRIGSYNLQAASSITRLTDAYQIIRKVVELQAPFRDRLLKEGLASGDRSLIERSKLVWLFPDINRDVSDFTPGVNGNSNTESAQILLNNLFDEHSLLRKDGRPLRYKFSDGRDVWGLFVYHKTGFNSLLTAQALGHSSLTSLLHYLDKRITRVEDKKRLIDLQGRVLTDLERGSYQPAQYRDIGRETLPEKPEKAATGLICTDPQNPDPDADPGNPGGRICRAQGCWTCSKWFATKESVPYLLRLVSDLEQMRDTIPVALWETSDYPVMLAVYAHILGKFSSAIVDAERERAMTLPAILSARQFVGRRTA